MALTCGSREIELKHRHIKYLIGRSPAFLFFNLFLYRLSPSSTNSPFLGGKGALPKIADNFELPPADEPLFRNEDESPVAHNRPIIREKPPIPPQNRAPAMPPSNPPSNKVSLANGFG